MTMFKNRTVAGKMLAETLSSNNYEDPVVLALPRGGVPIAIEVVRKIKAPLDLIMVRKIGLPHQPEVAAAAIVNGDNPELVINERIVSRMGLKREEIDELAKTQLAEIKRRRGVYMKDRAQVPVEGKTVIVVDDGIATGATVRASLMAIKRKKPAKIVLAVPVAPADTVETFRAEVDEFVCLETPEFFQAIGLHYNDFSQVTDEEVVRLLAEADNIIEAQ